MQKMHLLTVTLVAAALLLAIPHPVHAQDPVHEAPISVHSSLDEPLDFSKINNTVYDYNDILHAKIARQSDDDVARILKIAQESGLSFAAIVAERARGESFIDIAEQAGVSLSGLKNIHKEKDELAAYEAAYFSSNRDSIRRDTIDKLLAQAAAKPQ